MAGDGPLPSSELSSLSLLGFWLWRYGASLSPWCQVIAGIHLLCQVRVPAVCLQVYDPMLPSSYRGHSCCLRSPSARRCTNTVTRASWGGSEGLLLLLGVLTLPCLKPVTVSWVAPLRLSFPYTVSYSRGPHAFCAQHGELVPAQCHCCCGELQMHAEEHWEALGPSRLTQIKDSFFKRCH